jgi:hypothetical protein
MIQNSKLQLYKNTTLLIVFASLCFSFSGKGVETFYHSGLGFVHKPFYMSHCLQYIAQAFFFVHSTGIMYREVLCTYNSFVIYIDNTFRNVQIDQT